MGMKQFIGEIKVPDTFGIKHELVQIIDKKYGWDMVFNLSTNMSYYLMEEYKHTNIVVKSSLNIISAKLRFNDQ